MCVCIKSVCLGGLWKDTKETGNNNYLSEGGELGGWWEAYLLFSIFSFVFFEFYNVC